MFLMEQKENYLTFIFLEKKMNIHYFSIIQRQKQLLFFIFSKKLLCSIIINKF